MTRSMMLRAAVAALWTTCLTACGDDPTRAVVITPDAARYATCPATFPAAPSLPALSSFKLPDGRDVVLLDVVIARETVTAKYILQGRGAWNDCASVVRYVREWSEGVAR